MHTFENIGITGFCEDKSHNPDKQFLLFNMYLTLSESPPGEWREFLCESRRYPRAEVWRRAWVEGEHLVVYCQPEELQREIEQLKQDVDEANRRYLAMLSVRARRSRLLAQEEAKERRMMQRLAEQLRF